MTPFLHSNQMTKSVIGGNLRLRCKPSLHKRSTITSSHFIVLNNCRLLQTISGDAVTNHFSFFKSIVKLFLNYIPKSNKNRKPYRSRRCHPLSKMANYISPSTEHRLGASAQIYADHVNSRRILLFRSRKL